MTEVGVWSFQELGKEEGCGKDLKTQTDIGLSRPGVRRQNRVYFPWAVCRVGCSVTTAPITPPEASPTLGSAWVENPG